MKNNTFVQFLKRRQVLKLTYHIFKVKKNFITDIFAYEY